jgi:hypothetical protein
LFTVTGVQSATQILQLAITRYIAFTATQPYHRLMPTGVPDAVKLVNQTFDLLEAAFPAMDKLR